MNQAEQGRTELRVTEIFSRHPNFTTQWDLLEKFLSNFPFGDRVLKNAKLSAQSPSVLVAKSNLLDGLSAMEKLNLVEKWQPGESPSFVQVSQRDLQVFVTHNAFS